MKKVGGGKILAGALHGKEAFGALLKETASEPLLGPEPLFLDFSKVQVATASFLRESVLAFRDHVRGRRSGYYPVITNANAEVRDELTELTNNRGDALMVCTLTTDHCVQNVRLLGDLHPKQKITFDLVQERGETDASELMRDYGARERVNQTTAWNNRLSALASLGLVVEVSHGRNKRYRRLFAGAD
jgi:hypothetical protein